MSNSMLGLDNKVVVVTGSSQGVGRGCAVQFARAGAKVVVVARGLERAEDAAEEVRSLGVEALAVAADVTRQEGVDRVVEASLERFGRIDVGINNVGGRAGEPKGTILESGSSYWEETTRLNLTSAWMGCQAFARAMIDRKTGGVIVNISSVAARKAGPALAPYAAAKAAVDQLTRTAARELAPHGIRVVGVAPGMVDTDSLRIFLDDEAMAERAKEVPAGRIALPDDLGRVVVMMASDLAGWVYGDTIAADGGEILAR